MARTTVAAQIAKLRKDREALEKRIKALQNRANDKVLARIVQLAKDNGLTVDDISKALGASKTAKPKAARAAKKKTGTGVKVAPKYRNPANEHQTWTGRGKTPLWAKALKDADQLNQALIAK